MILAYNYKAMDTSRVATSWSDLIPVCGKDKDEVRANWLALRKERLFETLYRCDLPDDAIPF